MDFQIRRNARGPKAPVAIYSLLLLVIAVSFQNCGKYKNQDSSSVTSNSADDGPIPDEPGPSDPSDRPAVTLNNPAENATVNGTVSVEAVATDDGEVRGVQFYLDGTPMGVEDTTSPYSVSWDTTAENNGVYTLVAKARDNHGLFGTSPTVVVTVTNGGGGDTTAPTATVTAPAGGANVSGATVAVTATASDTVGVVGVKFFVDNVQVGTEDTSSPYSFTWNSTNASNASHTLTVKARDAAGNVGTSAGVAVTVNNVNPNATFTWIKANILQPKCVKCHGATQQKGGVRWDTYTNAIKQVVKGNAAGSLFYQKVNSNQMPPAAENNYLNANQKKAVFDWIQKQAPND